MASFSFAFSQALQGSVIDLAKPSNFGMAAPHHAAPAPAFRTTISYDLPCFSPPCFKSMCPFADFLISYSIEHSF